MGEEHKKTKAHEVDKQPFEPLPSYGHREVPHEETTEPYEYTGEPDETAPDAPEE